MLFPNNLMDQLEKLNKSIDDSVNCSDNSANLRNQELCSALTNICWSIDRNTLAVILNSLTVIWDDPSYISKYDLRTYFDMVYDVFISFINEEEKNNL